uniref:Uncharacterized protein n=1 Tax=Timema shepardi TaxID=629360 RepID=A0A7R9B155_TIMSH|nr:unnamed protein product [Timema shepardi]
MFPGKRLDTSGEGPTVGILKNEDVKFLMLANSKRKRKGGREVGKVEKELLRKSTRAAVLVARGIKPTTIRSFVNIECSRVQTSVKTATLSLPPYLQNSLSKHGVCIREHPLNGLCIAIPGPTFLLPISELQVDVSLMTNIYVARSSGYAVGSIIGELACPALIRHLMVNDPKVLMRAALFLNTLCIVIFATLWWLSSQLGEKYCAITSDGYQLANQHDEEEDMMDINLTGNACLASPHPSRASCGQLANYPFAHNNCAAKYIERGWEVSLQNRYN